MASLLTSGFRVLKYERSHGVAPNVAQQILRHHDVRLTLATYTHTTSEAVSSELTKVPKQLGFYTAQRTDSGVFEGQNVANVAIAPLRPYIRKSLKWMRIVSI